MANNVGALTCTACCQERSGDQGIQCPKAHFFCSAKDPSSERCCVDAMVDAQIQSIRFQEANVLCPVCSSMIAPATLQSSLSKGSWKQLESAVEEAKKVAPSKEEGVATKVLATDSTSVQAKVEEVARQVRNDTLNLKCPHCSTAYFEFDGCMAVICLTCNKWFCGYCHDPFADSSTSHDHVLYCSMNEKRKGDHFASAEEIKQCQAKYRTKKLKQVLSSHGKDIQWALVLELQKDFQDHGIDREALLVGQVEQCAGET